MRCFRIKFKPENGIAWTQDHCTVGGSSIPSDITFQAHEIGSGLYKLVACGYGCLKQHSKGCYGNGALFVHAEI